MRALLAQQKWRQARDELKALVKVDRARYLPLLIDANIGLARKMLAGGQLSDARQVLDHLGKLAPPARLRELELEIAVKTGGADGPGGAEDALAKLIAALADSTAPLTEVERIKAADAAVLSFQPGVANDPTPPTQARVREELQAVQVALAALSRSAWTEVADALRRVSFRSAFGHWAIFIKGVAAFHAGEDERAVKLWRSLPPESATAKTSRAYRLLMVEATADETDAAASPAALDGACRLITGSAADFVTRADRLWREGQTINSYQAVRNKQEGFPSVALDWRGALTEFYFKAAHGMASDEWRKYVFFFAKLNDSNAFKDEVETMFAHRMTALLGRSIAPVEDLRRYWNEFLRIHQSIHGTNPVLASLGHGWLGEQLSQPPEALEDDWQAEDLPDANHAIEELETSIRLDPTNLKAQLHLCRLYEILEKTSERNRLLDGMTKRFPDDKNVLVVAARGCLERGVYKKALDYLERARRLDRLDPQIPRLIVAALEGQARTHFQQRRRDDAIQALARTGEWLTERTDDFQISRWSASARHAAMEEVWGVPSQAKVLLDESLRLSAWAVAPLLIAHLSYRECLKPHRTESPFLPAFERALGLNATPQEIGPLLRILEAWAAVSEKFRAGHERALIVGALKKAANQPFTRAEALALIEQTGHHAEYQRAMALFVHKILRGDPKDPAFRLWKLKLDESVSMDIDARRDELDAIITEATRRGDEATQRGARAMLRSINTPKPPPGFDYDPDHDYDDDGFGDDSLPPALMEEVMSAFSSASPDEIQRLLKNPPPGVPKLVVEEMIRLARGGLPPPPSASGAKGARPPKSASPAPSSSDPDQLNLF